LDTALHQPSCCSVAISLELLKVPALPCKGQCFLLATTLCLPIQQIANRHLLKPLRHTDLINNVGKIPGILMHMAEETHANLPA